MIIFGALERTRAHQNGSRNAELMNAYIWKLRFQ